MLFIVGIGQHKAVGELPQHSHQATISTNGEHTHTAGVLGPIDGHVGNNYQKYHCSNGETGSAGSHSHTIEISNTGAGNLHNNMQPFLAVFMWHRTF